MSLAGWSTATIVTSTPSGGGGWSTGTSNTGSATGSGWSTGSSDSGSGGGGWFAPAPVTQTTYPTTTSYPASYIDYQVAPVISYAIPGAGLQAGPFGEGGPYTPLDFPLLHELRPGERLEDLQTRLVNRSVLSYLVLGLVAYLLLKKR